MFSGIYYKVNDVDDLILNIEFVEIERQLLMNRKIYSIGNILECKQLVGRLKKYGKLKFKYVSLLVMDFSTLTCQSLIFIHRIEYFLVLVFVVRNH